MKTKRKTFISVAGILLGAVAVSNVFNSKTYSEKEISAEDSLFVNQKIEPLQPPPESDRRPTKAIDCSTHTHTQVNPYDENWYLKSNISENKKNELYSAYKVRDILDIFINLNVGVSPDYVEDTFSKLGTPHRSDIYFDLPSLYETFDITVKTSSNEGLSVTFKDGMLISKKYIKNFKGNEQIDGAFLKYETNLFKTNHQSGVFNENNKNIALNESMDKIAENVLKLFN